MSMPIFNTNILPRNVVTNQMLMQNNMVPQNIIIQNNMVTNVPQIIPNNNVVKNVTTNPIVEQPAQNNQEENSQILTKPKLQELVRETDRSLILEEEVEEVLQNYVEEFVDRCLNSAALIAKNRDASTIEVKDVQQYLTRNYNMWTPGFGTDEVRPYRRSLTLEAHKQRKALMKKALKKH